MLLVMADENKQMMPQSDALSDSWRQLLAGSYKQVYSR